MTIDDQIADLIRREGDYSNRSADLGGPTRWGITQAVARAHGYMGDMRALPIATAAQIYRTDYWAVPHFDVVASIAPRVAGKLFDIAVNCGPGTAGILLQRALNVLFGSALKLDGRLTPDGASQTTLKAYLAQRPGDEDEMVLLELIACFQGERYAAIVERNPGQRANVYGWVRARVDFGLDAITPPHLAA
jgi:lysozyme family protein